MRKPVSDRIRQAASGALGPLSRRSLGQTGLTVSEIGLGGESLMKQEKPVGGKDAYDLAVSMVRRALELGINYFDTAPGYAPSEKRLGDALTGTRRSDIVLATKTDKRDRDGAMKQLEESLKNLKVDMVDIWQIHHIDHQDEVKKVFGSDGAIQALQEAREQGLVKHLGVTGHYDTGPLLSCLKRFEFDTILIPTNAADVHKNSMIRKVLLVARRKKMGIIGMKVCCRGRIFDPQHLNSMDQAMAYALSLPISTAIIGQDGVDQLEENVRTAKMCDKLSSADMKKLEDMTKDYAHLACFYKKGNEEYNPFWGAYKSKK